MKRIVRIVAWLTRARFTAGSIAVVVDPDGRVLLVRERLRGRGRWGLPGGFWRRDESPADAVRRELREEIGLDVPDGVLEPVAMYRQSQAWHLDALFVVRSPAEPVLRCGWEIAEARWFSREELPPLNGAALRALRRVGPVLDGPAAAARPPVLAFEHPA